MAKNPKRLKLKDATELAEQIVRHFTQDFPTSVERIEVCGSYRRKENYINDIDVVLIPKDSSMIADAINSIGNLSGGSKKITGIIEIPKFIGKSKGMNIDIYVATELDYGAQVLTWTGSKRFNIRCRAIAKSKGLKLNQYGLYKNDILISSTESGILTELGLQEEFENPIMRVS